MLTLLLEYGKTWIKDLLWSAVALAVVMSAGAQIKSYSAGARSMGRNFYGGVRILDGNEPGNGAKRTMLHGVISHGSQFLEPARRRQPLTYYAPGSGVELAIRALPAPAGVAVIGLGAGTLAAYGRKGDQYRFYEINPLVIDFARREFTYLGDSDANVEVVLGDGRSSLEREVNQKFDLLVVDAFSGDSIPVHLLSLEAFELYFRRLKPNGVLALHISNASLDLEPVVQKAADGGAYRALLFHNVDNPSIGQSEAVWVLLTSGNQPYASLPKGGQPLTVKRHLRAWTDEYSNLLQILK
jgi:SAM-dependent methyltransferase